MSLPTDKNGLTEFAVKAARLHILILLTLFSQGARSQWTRMGIIPGGVSNGDGVTGLVAVGDTLLATMNHPAGGIYRSLNNFDGSGLASGVYIYRLTAGTFVASRRLMLVM